MERELAPTPKMGVVAWLAPLAAVLVAIVCMLLPIFWVGTTFVEPHHRSSATDVGALATLGVIFRGSARTIMRTSVMSTFRIATRGALRRVVRMLAVAWIGNVLGRLAPELMQRQQEKKGNAFVALTLGLVALTLSFAGVLLLTPEVEREGVLSGLDFWLVSVLAALPMLLHYVVMRISARITGVQGNVATRIDGIILQAYFTGAGSYLPLTSDVELEGTPKAKAHCSALILLGLIGGSLIAHLIGTQLDSQLFKTGSGMLLLYAFVFSFPMPPLEGGLIWRYSRFRWFFLWGFITFVFMVRLPEQLYGVL